MKTVRELTQEKNACEIHAKDANETMPSSLGSGL
jgi:hypothetical protein